MGFLGGSVGRMERHSDTWKSLSLFLLLTACSVVSCQNLNGGHGISGGQGNDATLVLTLRAIPLMPPANTNLLAFSATIVGVSLTPTSGGSVNVPLNSSSYQIDLLRLQSDTAFLGFANAIPPGTYTNMVISLANPMVTYCTQTNGIPGCKIGSVTSLTGGPAIPIISTSPFPLTLVGGQTDGLSIVANLPNALTVNPQTQAISAVNLGASNVVTAIKLPPTASSLAASAMDFVDDVTGIVSSVDTAAQTVTVQTATRGSLTAKAGLSTIVSPNCTTFNLGTSLSCAKQGQVASLDMTLNTDGTFRLLEYDPLATTGGDWIEGVVAQPPSSSTRFVIVTNDLVLAPSNTLIGSDLELGASVAVTLMDPKPFVVDSKGLNTPNSAFAGATDASVLQPGQTLAVHLVGFTPAAGASVASANVDFVYLRFTRVAGSVGGVAPPNTFTIQSLPSFFGSTLPVTVQLSNGEPSTGFDGINNASSLVSQQTVSISALYFGPSTGPTPTPTPFCASKVRVP